MKTTNRVFCSLAGLLLLGAVSIVPAQETGSEEASASAQEPTSPLLEASHRQQEEKRKEGGQSPSRVFTNEDLTRLFGTRSSSPPDESTDKPATGGDTKDTTKEDDTSSDPLKYFADRKKAQEAHDAKVAEAQSKVDEAEAKVQRLEKFVKSTRMVGVYGRQANPDLARPDLDAEEYKDWESLGNAARLAKATEALDNARTELADAQQELDSVKRSGS